MSRRARARADAHPWESGETPEPEDDQPEQWEDEPGEHAVDDSRQQEDL